MKKKEINPKYISNPSDTVKETGFNIYRRTNSQILQRLALMEPDLNWPKNVESVPLTCPNDTFMTFFYETLDKTDINFEKNV